MRFLNTDCKPITLKHNGPAICLGSVSNFNSVSSGTVQGQKGFTDMAVDPSDVTYFILKCMNLESLQKCIETGEWAYGERTNPPQPGDLLANAHKKGRVILIFSVNNQHGWHGFCESCSINEAEFLSSDPDTHSDAAQQKLLQVVPPEQNRNPSSSQNENNDSIETGIMKRTSRDSTVNSGGPTWHFFPVKWIRHFQMFTKQTCLSFEKTQHLSLVDGTPVNKARNWQEAPSNVGNEMCHLIEEYCDKLKLERQTKEQEKLALREESYFKAQENEVLSDVDRSWATVIEKVERELGKVHLVCPFGSQRYNCSLPSSDSDIFIVYQARTTQILGLDPPKQTIKNSDREVVDYTVLELLRYCELLVAGDPRCIETLFLLDTDAVSKASCEWRELCGVRESLLTKTCFDKYMKEAQGTTGLKQLQKWKDSNPEENQLSSKHNKLGYIVLRLLQNACTMAKMNTLKVWRDSESEERRELLSVRQGMYTYGDLKALIDRYMTDIERHKDNIQPDKDETKAKIQSWLLTCRTEDLQMYPHQLIS